VSETQVTGSAEFTWSGGPIPSAIGRYNVDGQILAFGQRLEITAGSLRFEDVPADDPYLRVRAEREIFGNTEVRRAGVLVAGNLSRPTIEPYTDPLTTEERALTLLVTGSDFDIDQGVGAIDFGTYVAPRVFVSYGIGMFEEENVIRVRYDLKRGFGVTGTSGGRDAGVDLSYRIEN
jgi:translocation and assembly module TamB